MTLSELISASNTRRGPISKPFIIAEAGVNHEGSMDLARRLIDEAQEGGADAIKFQTYKAGSIASKESPSYWDLSKEPTTSQYQLFKKYDSFWKNEYEELAKYCEASGIEFLSTPFDVESARFLNELMGVFKISSSDMNNQPFIEFLCGFHKPIVLSTGAAFLWEVEQAVSWIEAHGNPTALLHCILNYPTSDENANLAMISTLSEKFPNQLIGYSDHTLPKDMKTLEVATLLGARILEKHFTHDKTLPGNDHYHAMDKADLAVFKGRIETLLSLLGDGIRKPLESEVISRRNARRSLVAARPISTGQKIEPDDLTWKRPGTGIDPRDHGLVLGKQAIADIPEDTILQWKLLNDA